MRSWVRFAAVVAIASVSACLPAAAQAATTFTVNTTSDPSGPGCTGGTCSLRQALAAAVAGDTVIVPAGPYNLSLGELTMAPGLASLQGAGASNTIINAGGSSRVLHITGLSSTLPTTISGLTLTGGSVSGPGPNAGGGGLYVGSGGLLTLSGDTITANHVTVTSGQNNGGAGIYNDASGLTLVNTTISNNVATLTGSTQNNGGGGFYTNGGTLTITGSTINGNTVALGAGTTTQNNGGGGFYNNGSDMTVTNSSVQGNSAAVDGGTIVNGGGGLYNNGSNDTYTNATINLNQLTISADTGGFNGGGGLFDNGSNATFTNSSVVGNTASITGTTFNGGLGMWANGNSLTITGSTFGNNTGTVTATAGDNGGGAILDDTSSGGPILNSTFSGNQITVTSPATPNGGGAIFNEADGTNAVSDTTIAGNSINQPGGAILDDLSQFVFKNTIVANNTATPAGNCVNTVAGSGFSSAGYNIDSGNTCSFTGPRDQINTNPLLGTLANNGGPTLTMALLPGSPALGGALCTDASGTLVTTDQRGMPRPDPGDASGVCDVGAYEAQAAANTVKPKITGTPAQGNKLSCSQGSWTNNPVSFAYQWNRNGKAISGATKSTYTVQFADATATLTCTVTATSSDGPTSATSAGVLVGNAKQLNCPRPTGKLSGTKLGPLALGMTIGTAEHKLKKFRRLSFGFVDFCLYAGYGIRAAVPSSKFLKSLPKREAKRVKGRLVIALTANPFYSLNGVKPGVKVASVAKKLHLRKPIKVGLNTWYFAPGKKSTGVLKVRHGVVYEIGIADKQLTSGNRKSQQKFMAKFGSQ